jgi:hypothetical protein
MDKVNTATVTVSKIASKIARNKRAVRVISASAKVGMLKSRFSESNIGYFLSLNR